MIKFFTLTQLRNKFWIVRERWELVIDMTTPVVLGIVLGGEDFLSR
jgi:hypothetical protein